MSLEYSTMKIGTLSSLLHEDKKPVLLLGAGCSIKSGIPTTHEFVGKAAKWGYAREFGLSPEIVNIRRSDWLPWLRSKTWFNTKKTFSDNYPDVVENLLQPRAVRKDFMLKVLNPRVPPSRGYEQLSDLIGLKVFETILTTNFDSLIDNSCRQNSAVHGHQVVKNLDEIVKITTNPTFAQIIHLHGDVETYTDKNLLNELNNLDDKIIERLIPLIRDHPLIVIGYRGSEDSVMKGLLANQADKADYFPNGIYWCHYDKSDLEDIPANVHDLVSLIGSNFQLLKTPSFEDIIDEIWYNYRHQIKSENNEVLGHTVIRPTINDLRILESVSIKEFDQQVVKQRALNYCKSLHVWIPERPDAQWYQDFQLERDLIVKSKDNLFPTFAGYVLFGKNVEAVIPSATIQIILENNPVWLDYILRNSEENNSDSIERSFEINGNLWNQLDELTDLLAQFNKPFRLKGDVSIETTPYPPLAIKELLVNAIVHKDYSVEKPIQIYIGPEYLKILNPGGLTDELIKNLGDSTIIETISKGKRGLKGYRNPVIADFFYGSGAMDKAGSGLSDVMRLVNNANGQVNFGPNEDNSEFQSQIFPRPESIDLITKTATPSDTNFATFVGNMLEIISLPETIFIGYKNDDFPNKLWEEHPDAFIPDFQFDASRVLSFHPLDSNNTPLSFYIDKGTIEEISFNEYIMVGIHEKSVGIKLLNRTIDSYLNSLGLVVDYGRKRAYFPADNIEQNRTISYHARIKKATRTVAKRIINKKTEETLYWEHKSISYQLKNFGDTWCIILLPGYVFTVNGFKWLVRHDKISKLATKRSSIDYNKSVLNDLYFWLNIIGKGSRTNFLMEAPIKKGEILQPNLICVSANYNRIKINQTSIGEGLDGNDYEELGLLEDEIAHAVNYEKSNANYEEE